MERKANRRERKAKKIEKKSRRPGNGWKSEKVEGMKPKRGKERN